MREEAETTRLKERVSALEAKISGLEGLLGLQGGINAKILGTLQELQEQDKAPQSSLILPDRLNS